MSGRLERRALRIRVVAGYQWDAEFLGGEIEIPPVCKARLYIRDLDIVHLATAGAGRGGECAAR
jgi:hypothetical protein